MNIPEADGNVPSMTDLENSRQRMAISSNKTKHECRVGGLQYVADDAPSTFSRRLPSKPNGRKSYTNPNVSKNSS